MMKVLHYSDQSEPNLENLFLESDVMFTTGDLSVFDFTSIELLIPNKVSFGVYGNHDDPGYMEKLGIINVHLKVFEWRGLTIGGFQGCPRYKSKGGPQFTEEEAFEDLKNFSGVDIFLLHAAPYGLLDTPNDEVHTGSKIVRDYVDRTNPRYIFCGHDSPSKELKYNNTQIFRTHQTKLIELNI